MDDSSKLLTTNEKLIQKALVISQRRSWLPRALHNLFRNESKVSQLFSEVLANQNILLAHSNTEALAAEWRKDKARLEAENEALRAQLAAAIQRSEQAQTHPVFHFLHIPKTAGTSVTSYLSEAFGEECVHEAHATCEILDLDRANLRSRRLITGHFFGLLDPFLGIKTRKITFLRDPFERAVSNILHGQRHEASHLSNMLKQYSVEEILTNPSFAWLHHNYQARYIASLAFSPYSLKDHPPEGHAHPHHLTERLHYECLSANRLDEVARLMMAEFDFVGLSENLGVSLKGIAEAWNLPYPSRDYTENQNPNKTSYSSKVSDRVRRDFYRQNELDYELWNSVKKKLALRDCAAFPTSASVAPTIAAPLPEHANI